MRYEVFYYTIFYGSYMIPYTASRSKKEVRLEQDSTIYKEAAALYKEEGYVYDIYGKTTGYHKPVGYKRINYNHYWYNRMSELLYDLIREYQIPLSNVNIYDPTENKYNYDCGIYANVYDENGRHVEFKPCRYVSDYGREQGRNYTASGYDWYRPKRRNTHGKRGRCGSRSKYRTYGQGMRQNTGMETDYKEAIEYIPGIRRWRVLDRGVAYWDDSSSPVYSRNPRSWKNKKIRRQWQKNANRITYRDF